MLAFGDFDATLAASALPVLGIEEMTYSGNGRGSDCSFPLAVVLEGSFL